MSHPFLTTTVAAVHRDAEHRFSKQRVASIELQAGMGVVGDAHWGRTVQHAKILTEAANCVIVLFAH